MNNVRNAVWREWPHVGVCYRVRNRGARSAFSREGFCWTDTRGNAMDRPGRAIRFHRGPRDGQIEEAK